MEEYRLRLHWNPAECKCHSTGRETIYFWLIHPCNHPRDIEPQGAIRIVPLHAQSRLKAKSKAKKCQRIRLFLRAHSLQVRENKMGGIVR